MANPIIQLVRNDTEPQLELVLTSGSSPMDLTGKRVYLHLRRNARSGVLLTREAVVPTNTATEGKAYVDWTDGDLDLSRGTYEAEIEVTGTDNYRQTVFEVLELEVREDFA